MKLVIDHLTRYGYDEEVKFSTQYLRLTPRSTGRQNYRLDADPAGRRGGDHHRRVGQCPACADAG
jgi:hypothetical protein